MIKKKNSFIRIVYALLFAILSVVIFIGVLNGKEAEREGCIVYVKPLEYHVSYTKRRSVSFKFEYESREFEHWISYHDYKKIKKLEQVKMLYYDKLESFDLNMTPNLNAKLGILDYLLILLPNFGVIYNVYMFRNQKMTKR